MAPPRSQVFRCNTVRWNISKSISFSFTSFIESYLDIFIFFTLRFDSKNILFIQDIDGVCIPLVKDPMTRKLESKFIFAVKNLEKEFYVLTCGEHEGPRGVNRIVERSLRSIDQPKEKGLYLRGLAACGVEYQDNNGNIIHWLFCYCRYSDIITS